MIKDKFDSLGIGVNERQNIVSQKRQKKRHWKQQHEQRESVKQRRKSKRCKYNSYCTDKVKLYNSGSYSHELLQVATR